MVKIGGFPIAFGIRVDGIKIADVTVLGRTDDHSGAADRVRKTGLPDESLGCCFALLVMTAKRIRGIVLL